jgi:quinol monooxygenase YgiN
MANSMLLTIPVKPECLNDFIGTMKEALPDTRAYDGCQQIDVWTSEDEPGKVTVFEIWESKAHQEKYFAWRIESGMMDALAPMLTGEPTVTWLHVHDI